MVKKCLISAVMVTVFLLGCSVVEVGEIENTYFPLAEGNTWMYEVSGERGKDTILCELIEIEPGVFSWYNDIGYNYYDDEYQIFLVDGSDSGDPFDDSTKITIDSLLDNGTSRWTGVGNIPAIDESSGTASYSIDTPLGKFTDCILVEGYVNDDAKRYDIWFAPGVGPVQVFVWSGKKLLHRFSLIDFWLVR